MGEPPDKIGTQDADNNEDKSKKSNLDVIASGSTGKRDISDSDSIEFRDAKKQLIEGKDSSLNEELLNSYKKALDESNKKIEELCTAINILKERETQYVNKINEITASSGNLATSPEFIRLPTKQTNTIKQLTNKTAKQATGQVKFTFNRIKSSTSSSNNSSSNTNANSSINEPSPMEINNTQLNTNTESTTVNVTQPLSHNQTGNSTQNINRAQTEVIDLTSDSKTADSNNSNAKQVFKKNENTLIINVFNISQKRIRDIFVNELGLRSDHFQFTSINSKKTRIMVNCDENHRRVTEYLSKVEKVNFFAHTPQEQKPKNYLIKNILDSSYTAQDILDAVNNLNLDLNIISIKRLETPKSRREDRYLNIWLIQLEQNSKDLKKILSTKYLLNTCISIESLKPSGPIQCKNCQRFHHTASNCNMPFRCVKCTQQHEPGNCALSASEKNDLDKIQCINCSQFGHPSNYRGCPKAKEILSRNASKQIDKQSSKNTNISLPSANIRSNVTFASIVKPHSDNVSANPLQFLNNEILKYYGMNWNDFSKKISEFLSNYNTLDNDNKKQALLEFVISTLNNFNPL